MNNKEISKCLAEVSALVAAGHPYEECVQSRFTENLAKRLGIDREWREDSSPLWKRNDFEFRVAKGFVEGKPVFEGDVLYDSAANISFTVEKCYELKFFERWKNSLHWTPPAPKVEIPEGFIEWWGGECPVDYDSIVEVMLRSGERPKTREARGFYWQRGGGDTIIAYKIHKPTTFTLNGEVLPMPTEILDSKGCYVTVHVVPVNNELWYYNSSRDADKVRAAFAKLTEGL